MKLKQSNGDKTQKLKLWQKNKLWQKITRLWKTQLWQNIKTKMWQSLNCDKIQVVKKIKMWQNPNHGEKTQKLNLATQIAT